MFVRVLARVLALSVGLTSLVGGCAREAGSGSWPGGPSAPRATPRAYDPSARESLRIPGGKRCLELLDELGVDYRRLGATRGMRTPVEVRGAIAGIRYVSHGKPSLVCDCRLALALHWSSSVLSSFRVSEVKHFGAYAYRKTRKGRPSLHARGLALDAAAFRMGDTERRVAKHYAPGWGDGCVAGAPALNQIACRLRALGIFRELITPDHDSDHRDHFHLAILPL